MSQIASFYLLETSLLGELEENARLEIIKKLFSKKIINHYTAYLEKNATYLYGLSPDHLNANPFITIMTWVTDEKNINLYEGLYNQIAEAISKKMDATTLIWTKEDKDAFLSSIDIDKIPVDELKKIALENGDDSDEEVAVLREVIKEMRNIFNRLESEKQVIIVAIG